MQLKLFTVGTILAGVYGQTYYIETQYASLWGQCGGIGWTGPSYCRPPVTCSPYNVYYSQCLTPTTPPVPTTTTALSICPTSVYSEVRTGCYGKPATKYQTLCSGAPPTKFTWTTATCPPLTTYTTTTTTLSICRESVYSEVRTGCYGKPATKYQTLCSGASPTKFTWTTATCLPQSTTFTSTRTPIVIADPTPPPSPISTYTGKLPTKIIDSTRPARL